MAPTNQAADDARAVGVAAHGVLQAIRSGGVDRDAAVDWLEVKAKRVVGDQTNQFDARDETATDEDLVAMATAQLGIGVTLVAAEAAVQSPGPENVSRFQSAIDALEGTADALEMEQAGPAPVQGIDVAPGGAPLSLLDAARAALDEMAAGAAEVATAVLDKTLRPIIERIPEPVRNLVNDLDLDVGGRLARWGLRAVRRALDILQRLADLDAVERMRDQIDGVLKRLGSGEDAAVLAGWAIGADSVGAQLVVEDRTDERAGLVAELARLSARFATLCRMLRGLVVALTGLASALALLHVTIPHAAAITAAGVVLVLGTTIVLGRDYTGASDLPGRVQGVRVLLRKTHDDLA